MNKYESEEQAIEAGIESPERCAWCETYCDYDDTTATANERFCDDCYHGVQVCVCGEWTHSDVETWDNLTCPACAEKKSRCTHCDEQCDDLRLYETIEWHDGRRVTATDMLCDDCRAELHPEELLDINEAAEAMSEATGMDVFDATELIENNRDTGGTAWRLLAGDSPDYEAIARMMGVSKARHEDTGYDDMLRAGFDRDVAREIIKTLP
jgi:hypothetical protein